jgi:hypothetical protein
LVKTVVVVVVVEWPVLSDISSLVSVKGARPSSDSIFKNSEEKITNPITHP